MAFTKLLVIVCPPFLFMVGKPDVSLGQMPAIKKERNPSAITLPRPAE